MSVSTYTGNNLTAYKNNQSCEQGLKNVHGLSAKPKQFQNKIRYRNFTGNAIVLQILQKKVSPPLPDLNSQQV